MNDIGYVYIILNMSEPKKQILRIGKTKSNNLNRPKSQCAYLPFKTCYFAFKVENYTSVETNTHRFLKEYKLNGDWFECDLSRVINFIDTHNVLEYNFPSMNEFLTKRK